MLSILLMGSFNFEIPEDLHKEFKIKSIREEKEMREILVELIKEYVERGGK